MPGPARTKGALKNTRYKAKMNKRNRTKKRKQAFYIHELGRKQQQEYLKLLAEFTLYISRKLEKEGKIKAVESCDGAFETYYSEKDSLKIVEEVSKKSTKPERVQSTALSYLESTARSYLERSRSVSTRPSRVVKEVSKKSTMPERVHSIGRSYPRSSRSSTSLRPSGILSLFAILGVVLSGAYTAEAKWYELRSPPGELSLYDTTSAGLIATAFTFGMTGPLAPFLIAGMITSSAGSAQRLYNDYTGLYPMTTADKVTNAIGVLYPGYGSVCRNLMQGVAYFEPRLAVNFTRNSKLGQNLSEYVPESQKEKAQLSQWVFEKQIEAAPAIATAIMAPKIAEGLKSTSTQKNIGSTATNTISEGVNSTSTVKNIGSTATNANPKTGALFELAKTNPKAAGAAVMAGTFGAAAALDATGVVQGMWGKNTGTGTNGQQGNQGNQGNQGKATG